MSDKPSRRPLRKTAEEWLRADYHFRFGRFRYSYDAQEMLIKAERRLRRAIIGYSNLEAAFEKLKQAKVATSKGREERTDGPKKSRKGRSGKTLWETDGHSDR